MIKFHEDGTIPDDDMTVFVFGSNEGGYHGAGAALVASEKYRRPKGTGFGLYQGNGGITFAIPTKDMLIRTLPWHVVGNNIRQFCEFAIANQHLNFFLTRVGCGLAGFSDEDVAYVFNMFMPKLASNVSFPITWKPFLDVQED